ncbi:EF-P beta-lysylation protein EpmB [Thiocystis violacea]|uniref:EF-P beta-lysylation protein EpmB n=1 Tax=Thiocystis violacea TaxID=13725 RepID=UPI0019082D3B|nr:EF-P beta-lysylation protein EpmB [Thiocystis violacea]MBK1719920.1 EF-P beta-lysylation protein EpmB [Thiocystis violacea]
MLPRRGIDCQTDAWKRELARSFTQVDALLAFLGLDRADVPGLDPEPGPFGILVPRGFAALMARADPGDPLLRQVLSLSAERAQVAGYVRDPVDDASAEQRPGLLRKYSGRALLVTTGACAIHCRYCFRRHFPYQDLGPSQSRWDRALTEIARDETLTEVILSGGDPLMVEDGALADLARRLAGIVHLRRWRLHSRLPVVLPSRITDRLGAILTQGRLPTVLVIHANHPRELGEEAREALLRLDVAGVTLLNQSVLLRGVNDDAGTLIDLSERLFDCRVRPYYLHRLDPVEGAAHFQVSEHEAMRLIETMRGRMPGYLVPNLVREIPGAPSKQRVA